MGQAADDMLNGLCCQVCGRTVYDEDEHLGVEINGKPCNAWDMVEYNDLRIQQMEANCDYLMEQYMLYVAYHNTEKTMREFAELDLSKFKRIFGRIFWLKK